MDFEGTAPRPWKIKTLWLSYGILVWVIAGKSHRTANSEIFERVYFRQTSHTCMRSFVRNKPSRNSKIILSFTDVGKSIPIREFLTSQICLLMLFAKIKLSRKFPNLKYLTQPVHILSVVPTSIHHRTPLKWHLAGGPMMAIYIHLVKVK